MDWRCSGDQQTASTQTKDGPRGCPTLAEVATGKSLSSNLGTESGESGSAATALAPASAGADAHADYESATGRGDERGLSLEEKAVQRTRYGHSFSVVIAAQVKVSHTTAGFG